MESGPVVLAAVADPVPEAAPQEVTEEYLRTLGKDELLFFLSSNGITVPDPLKEATATALVSWVLDTYAE